VYALVAWVADRITGWVQGRRKVRFTMHIATFEGSSVACYFLTVANLSRDRDIEVTHVWMALDGDVQVRRTDRPLPKRLNPDESWATWIRANVLPLDIGERVFTSGRVRLSSDKVIKSRKDTTVPSRGDVPGGPISNPLE
jgi:hypothetical protein